MLKDEKLQILNMIQDGRINAEEGVKLLEALENSLDIKDENVNSGKKAKWIKIKVLDTEKNTKVNVTLPISLINLGVRLASKFSPEIKEAGLSEDDMTEIFDAIKNGETGRIVDIDSAKGDKVEIVIE